MALTINTKIQNDADNYSLDAKQVKGGYGVVAVAADLPNLPAATIVEGSLYYVQETDKFYIYNGSTWNEAEFGGGNVTDVKINGTSIVTDKVAEIPKASASDLGVVKLNSQNGINIDNTGTLLIWEASDNEIATKTSYKKPIVPATLNKAVMEGLGNNSLTWSDEYKASARATIGAGTGTVSSLSDLAVTANASELNILDGATLTTTELNYVDGVTSNIQTQLDSKSSVSVSVSGTATDEVNYITVDGTEKKLPSGGDDAQFGADDILEFVDGTNTPVEANPIDAATSTLNKLKVGTTTYEVGGGGSGTITDVKVNNTSVVTEGVANIPLAGGATPGVVKVSQANGINIMGGILYVVGANTSEIEAKTTDMKPLTPRYMDKAIMEGLGNNSLTWSDAYKSSARNTIGASAVSVSSTGTATDTVQYITVDGVEKKLAGGGGGNVDDVTVNGVSVVTNKVAAITMPLFVETTLEDYLEHEAEYALTNNIYFVDGVEPVDVATEAR